MGGGNRLKPGTGIHRQASSTMQRLCTVPGRTSRVPVNTLAALIRNTDTPAIARATALGRDRALPECERRLMCCHRAYRMMILLFALPRGGTGIGASGPCACDWHSRCWKTRYVQCASRRRGCWRQFRRVICRRNNGRCLRKHCRRHVSAQQAMAERPEAQTNLGACMLHWVTRASGFSI